MVASDEELVARAVSADDHKAYGELVQRYQGQIRGWLRQLTGDAVRADELAQDTFIRAWEKLYTFRGRGKFGAWLMKLAYNTFLQSHRGAKRQQRLVEAVRSHHASVSAELDSFRASELPDLPKMLSVLSDDERHAMVLCYAFGLSHAEASEVTGLPLGTVKSHIKRGKSKIRSRFNIEEPGHD